MKQRRSLPRKTKPPAKPKTPSRKLTQTDDITQVSAPPISKQITKRTPKRTPTKLSPSQRPKRRKSDIDVVKSMAIRKKENAMAAKIMKVNLQSGQEKRNLATVKDVTKVS